MQTLGQENQDIKTIINDLDERTKELNCLYQIDEILNDTDNADDHIFQSIVDILPNAFRFANICRAMLQIGGEAYFQPDLVKTELKLSANIISDNEVLGTVSIYYTKPIRMEKGVFVDSERRLVNSIANKISKYLVLKKLKESINLQHQGINENVKTSDRILDKTKEWLRSLHLTDEEIDKMCQIKLNFKKGETFCKQGALTSYIMILADGLSKNYLEGNLERGYNFNIVKPFDFVGLATLYSSQMYHFSGAAITPCTFYLTEASVFKEIVAQNPEFTKIVFNWYCSIAESHLDRLSCIANKNALGKVCDILLYLYEKIFTNGMIENSLSRKDIAELAGMSTESAVRILSELKKDGIIKILHNGIEIVKLERLKILSRAG